MTRLLAATAMAAIALAGVTALGVAQSKDKPDLAMEEGGRYSFHRTGDVFIRLDSRTGAVSQCEKNAVGWACATVPDERAALESEIARLQGENTALKKAMLAKGVDLPSNIKPDLAESKDGAPAGKDATPKMPSDAELDRAFAFMKKIWRRMIDMMADVQRDIQKKS